VGATISTFDSQETKLLELPSIENKGVIKKIERKCSEVIRGLERNFFKVIGGFERNFTKTHK
jgi:hypothetical protein